jgi:Flp pilus assembly pilin Flp
MAKNALPTDHMSMRAHLQFLQEDGQTAAEYSVLLAVITPAIVAVIALLAMGVADTILSVVNIF